MLPSYVWRFLLLESQLRRYILPAEAAAYDTQFTEKLHQKSLTKSVFQVFQISIYVIKDFVILSTFQKIFILSLLRRLMMILENKTIAALQESWIVLDMLQNLVKIVHQTSQ